MNRLFEKSTLLHKKSNLCRPLSYFFFKFIELIELFSKVTSFMNGSPMSRKMLLEWFDFKYVNNVLTMP